MTPKKIIKGLIPNSVLQIIENYLAKKHLEQKYKGMTTQQVFTKIYEEGAWSGKSMDPSQKFCSGLGSHDTNIVSEYIKSIQSFLDSFDKKQNVVDLGCGDFFVGSRIRSLCDNYTACDIVPNLIAFNKEKYKELNVDFQVLDLTEDELPKGDIVFIRQVLQHLSNRHIKNAIPRISGNYKFLVLTEHLPKHKDFKQNLDKPAGSDIRLSIGSGLVLTKPPFNLRVVDERVLCEVPQFGGIIRTTVYTLS
ncbi:class I SAM-dependent methyltransferase [Ferrovum myxofaciens]|uniref:class I SAM-dependent methyltransferase n=1 Tax=Ferrovum myxofaciens TaxID=416213 RepID=UPI003EB8A84A